MLVGCGGDANYDSTDGQFANEPAGNYDAEITQATFKPKQTVAQTNDLLLSVENTGDKTIPALALTVRLVGEGSTLPFAYRDEQTGLASPQRPVWVMEEGYPKLAGTVGQGGTGSANQLTKNFGELEPGETADTVWRLTPVRPGAYRVRFSVAAGLSGQANAVDADGGTPEVTLPAFISARAQLTQVDDKGNVVPFNGSTNESGN